MERKIIRKTVDTIEENLGEASDKKKEIIFKKLIAFIEKNKNSDSFYLEKGTNGYITGSASIREEESEDEYKERMFQQIQKYDQEIKRYESFKSELETEIFSLGVKKPNIDIIVGSTSNLIAAEENINLVEDEEGIEDDEMQEILN